MDTGVVGVRRSLRGVSPLSGGEEEQMKGSRMSSPLFPYLAFWPFPFRVNDYNPKFHSRPSKVFTSRFSCGIVRQITQEGGGCWVHLLIAKRHYSESLTG